ncbi:ABC transporter permease [Novosphingobium pokkalii]|uniref:ABC transporter permease n=1 Tax=Novosphingobium pokkalii TaxID=1770194 RepID=A0ABV7V695_9SPHN|nr:ABC transporter permease [Novosphingobium pokkalii]GHC89271.1 hypothetical protein GCM10019060_12870 [Novosphingobium pokkalii]
MSIAAGFRAEVDRLGHNRLDLALLTVVPAVMLALMAAMLFAGSPRGLGVVVVDRDGGPLARAIVRDLAASPQLRVVAVTGQIGQGLSALRQERAVAVVVVPRGVATGLRRPGAAPVEVLYAAQFLATGAVAQTSAELAVASALAAGPAARLGLYTARLPGVHVALLGNPTGSLEWYLGLLLGPGILHLAIAVTAIGALTPLLQDGSFAAFVRTTPGAAGQVVGRLLPHVGAGTALATAWLLWLVLARGYRVEGGVLALVGGYALLFAATVSIALFLLALVREPATALSGAVIVAGSALAYSGASLPINGSPWLVRVWNAALPLTHGLRLQMDAVMGAAARPLLAEAGALLLYPLVPGALGLWLVVRAR